MAITIQSSRDNANDKTVFFTIAYDSKDYKWHGDMPLAANEQDYLDDKSDTLKAEILRKEYPMAVVPQLEAKTPLECFEAWVSGGCTNAEIKGKGHYGEEIVIKEAEVIEKLSWVDSH